MSSLKDRLGRTVPQHDGAPANPRQVFFGPSHVALIGPIQSAHSTQTTSRRPRLPLRTQTCSYVGQRGVVVHRRRGRGELETRVLRFRDVYRLPDEVFERLPGGPDLQHAARAAWQRELLRRRVDQSLLGSAFRFAYSYQPAT